MEREGISFDNGSLKNKNGSGFEVIKTGFLLFQRGFADFLLLFFLFTKNLLNKSNCADSKDQACQLAIGFLAACLISSIAFSKCKKFVGCLSPLLSAAFVFIGVNFPFYGTYMFIGFLLGVGRWWEEDNLPSNFTGNLAWGKRVDHWSAIARVIAFMSATCIFLCLLDSNAEIYWKWLAIVSVLQVFSSLLTAAYFFLPGEKNRESILPLNANDFAEERSKLLFIRSVINGLFLAVWFYLITQSAALEPLNSEKAQYLIWLVPGGILGCLFSFLSSHPYRSLGNPPWAFIFAGTSLLMFAQGVFPSWTFALFSAFTFHGFFCSRRFCRPEVPFNSLFCEILFLGGPILLSFSFYGLFSYFKFTVVQLSLVLCASGIIFSILFFRPFLEELISLVCQPFYQVRYHGPGLNNFPPYGPVLVIANHAAYLDPFWLGKAVPRPIIPMMTSVFYDLSFVSFLMKRVVHAIRVEESGFRRLAPELEEAKREILKGGCLVVFPEGRLRRHEEQLIGSFGQGVWHILKELPETPVVPVWIEGGWGSFTSRKNGPPMVNKRMDWLRKINVVVGQARVIPKGILEDHRSTRDYLRSACLSNREILGLPIKSESSFEDNQGPQEGQDRV